ncbi:hypothetical protein A9Q78_08715 [Methylophaga sp. 41_12_T18]|nr:hypothetical protein A9Q78_08715 [Methylophaga sp. 41_12_T18]
MNKIKIIYLTAISLFIVAILPMLTSGLTEQGVRWAVRRSVDIAFILFAFSFGASSLQLLTHSRLSKWLLQNRRYLGISFGISFLLHGSLIFLLARLYPEPLLTDLTDNVIYTGLIAFSLTFLMTISSNNAAVKLLGRNNWSRLHTIGGYYLLIMFSLTFLSKLAELQFWPYIILTLCLISLRIYKIIKQLTTTLHT